ncbi:MAG: hypothetical protein ABW162_15940 [Candidatus Sedimenticola sp. PURPLELP]
MADEDMTPEAAETELERLSGDGEFRANLLGENGPQAMQSAHKGWHSLQQKAYSKPETDPSELETHGDATAVETDAYDDIQLRHVDGLDMEQIGTVNHEVRALVRDIGLPARFSSDAINLIEDAVSKNHGTGIHAEAVADQTAAYLKAAWGNEFDANLDKAMAILNRAGERKHIALESLLKAGPEVYSWVLKNLLTEESRSNAVI